jgi:hypothetical protein
VTDEADLLRAAAAASARAEPGESVVAVLAAAPFLGPVLYLCALRAGPEDAPLSWVAFDDAGVTVTDERLIREAASLSALCETAEEASGALLADEVARTAHAGILLAGDDHPSVKDALRGVEHAARGLVGLSEGVRVASAPYLDQLADAARTLGGAGDVLRAEAETLTAHLSGTPGDPLDPLARAVWEVLGRLHAAGPPERVGEAIGAAAGAVDALAGDVVHALRPAGGG